MNKFSLKISLVVLIFAACKNDGPTKEEFEKVKKELEDCRQTVIDFNNTPLQRLAKAQNYSSKNDYANAKTEFQQLIDKFPGTPEAKIAENTIAQIDQTLKEQEKNLEKKKTLGFKTLQDLYKVKFGNITLSFSNVSVATQWTFDSYGNEWHYRKAERGNRLIVAKVSISSDVKDPNLPSINVYKINNGELNLLGTMGYEFVRWEDYATYLGNYSDMGNDFAHSKTIPFSCGLEISQTDVDGNAVFVVVNKSGCFYRSTDRFGNPPIKYSEGGCDLKQTLTVNDLENDYTVIKIFNRNKL